MPIVNSVHIIIKLFKSEFSAILTKFDALVLPIHEVKEENNPMVWHPGCYIWHDGKQVVKVGRSLNNSRKRALEHLSAKYEDPHAKDAFDTLHNAADAKLILFNVVDLEQYHWVAAVEIFMEKKLNPVVKSKRQG